MPMCASIRTGSPISCSRSCSSDVVAVGRAQRRARRRSVGGAVRRACARRTDARALRRPHRRARARLQHGVPPRRAARHRRLQSDLPARRRRRGRVLAAAGARLARSGSRRRRSSGITIAPSIGAYWRQQVGYGEGEVWLQPHHPDKFVGSRIQWRGHVYSPLPFVRSLFGTRVNAGPWGTAPFPSVYRTERLPALLRAAHADVAGRRALVLVARRAAALATDRRRAWPGDRCGRTARRSRRPSPAACAMRLPPTSARCRRCPAVRRRCSRVLTRGADRLAACPAAAGARAAAALRGMLTSPEFELAHDQVDAARRRGTSRPTCSRSLPRARQALRFWSEAWLARETLLTRIVERMRSTRVATALEIDERVAPRRATSACSSGAGAGSTCSCSSRSTSAAGCSCASPAACASRRSSPRRWPRW